MANIYKPLKNKQDSKFSIFLAGSIGVDKPAEQWQERVSSKLEEYDINILNPRRDDWDSSWKQDPTEGTQFYNQVIWEQKNIESSEVVLFYFDANTQSPITLLELGLCLGNKKKIFVMCPENFFRYGNVVLTCSRYGVVVYTNEDDWMENVKSYLDSIFSIVNLNISEDWCLNENNKVEDPEVLDEKISIQIEDISVKAEEYHVNIIQQPLNEEVKKRVNEKYVLKNVHDTLT